MKKSLLTAVGSGMMVLASSMPMQSAFAGTNYLKTNIELNGQEVASPVHITAVDPSSRQLTTFMPIFFANEVLQKLGITSTWDGSNWSLTVPESLNANLDKPSTGVNDINISINGTAVQTGPKVVAVDPSSGEKTTFVPIWYLAQVLNRIGLQSSWDGTTWSLTKVIPETQQNMATSMWNVFDGVSWAVQHHPTMSQVGINPTSSPVTAGDVATWLSDWAGQAKGTTPYFGPKQGQWVPYSLQYEVSSDPYTWAQINGLYEDTTVSSASSALTASDAQQILTNLQWWLTGDKVINGVHHLHVPFYSNYLAWYDQLNGNNVSLASYESVLSEVTRIYDEVTATVSGTTINVTLPDTTFTTNKLAWDVVDGYWEYGGWQASDNKGGKTIQVPDKGTSGLGITLATLLPNLYLEGYSVMYPNANGLPKLSNPMSILVGQTQEGN